ncbi:MAG TPA: sigma 54-interacting transcriptional regulator [Phenylobacterium sp.]|uniref:sigma 54-interacting transcriptional regulator n=1 Tax=Phenylobacterium sp. TaxID=1871053 RepID=UPI002B49D704|nr:sigma 54-interacting transcriptional regulator [Phenylobacterium sp.]HKR89705.1 sigma 54-interacting transcriptional regulator [Phenylobacterium sp.]
MPTVEKKILIADDDSSMRLVLSQAFMRLGHQVRATGNVATLMKWIGEGDGDLIVSDVLMAEDNVFDVLPRIRKERPKLPVILISGQNNVLTAINAAEAGCFEYIAKPFNVEDVLSAARRALSSPTDPESAKAQARAVRDERLPLIGRSPPMQEVYRAVAKLVRTDLTVLLTGESGTGKELVARVLHDMGRRRAGQFVGVNLAATHAERVEAKLFGGDDGAGGKLIEADGGTLFLDEIDGMSLDAQMRLLRVIDGSEAVVNPRTNRRCSIRVIAATTRDLRGMIQQGLFREDLFFRLNVAPLRLPPLRERLDDIPELSRAFLLRAAREGLPTKTIDATALERLKLHRWPGNVRELENLIRRICAMHPDDLITARIIERELVEAPPGAEGVEDEPETLSQVVERKLASYFADDPVSAPPPALYDHLLDQLERPLFRMTLAATRGNQLRAAALLGLNRNTLRKKIEDRGMEVMRRRRRRSQPST